MLARRPDIEIVNKKKKKKRKKIEDFVILADHWVKLRESKTRDKYVDLAREPKKYGRWK